MFNNFDNMIKTPPPIAPNTAAIQLAVAVIFFLELRKNTHIKVGIRKTKYFQ
jgi:hypothetical protein